MRCVMHLAFWFAIATSQSPAMACDRTPELAQLPNETNDEFDKRLSRIEHEREVVRKYQDEKSVVEFSPVIYVARVIGTSRSDENAGKGAMPWAVVQPIKSIRGKLPANTRRLTIKAYSSCSSFGDGFAAGSELGEIVFVFEGLPKSEALPNGIDSLWAGGVLTPELVDGLLGYDSKKP